MTPGVARPPATGAGAVAGWAKLPCTWQVEADQHRALAQAQPGAIVAALKIYLAICLYAMSRVTQFSPGVVIENSPPPG